MASLITHSLSYSKESAEQYFMQPLFVGANSLDIFEIMTNVKSSQKLDKFSTLEKISKAEAAGFSGATGVTYTQRSVSVARVEAEVGQAGGAFFNSVKGELLKMGIYKDDISGTVLEEIVANIFTRGIMRDKERQLWFSDTTFGGTDYNIYDGIFKQLDSLPAAQKLVFPAGAIGADVAEAQFQLMKDAAPNEMLENRADLVILASRSVVENYRNTLKDLGTELAHMNVVDGVQRLMWDGIPIIEKAEWDTHLTTDSATIGNTDVHRVVMTVKNNIVVATDYDQNVGAEMWYNRDEKENRFRFQYVIGTQFKNDELTVTNIAA